MKIPCTIVGSRCRAWRLEHGYTQQQIADDLGYKQSNISRFEVGKNDNCFIFLWYVMHGFDPNDLRGDYTNEC